MPPFRSNVFGACATRCRLPSAGRGVQDSTEIVVRLHELSALIHSPLVLAAGGHSHAGIGARRGQANAWSPMPGDLLLSSNANLCAVPHWRPVAFSEREAVPGYT
jgi:hypothetical protein